MEGYKKQEGAGREEIHSRVIRAGKRTYFFDVKATKSNDYYLTITESKKRYEEDGQYKYEKHKIFLYKEDFDNFVEGLEGVIQFIRSENDDIPITSDDELDLDLGLDDNDTSLDTSKFTNVSFEDL